jgi:hypothetical protein
MEKARQPAAVSMTKLAIIAVIAALVLWVIAWQGKQYQRFLEGAKKVTGTVDGKVVKRPNPDVPSRTENWLLFSYSVGGETFSRKERIEFGDLWDGFSQGQELEIYYSEDKPSVGYPASVLERRVDVTQTLSR